MTEYELIKSAKKGDKDAFCTLYGMYKQRLYKYAYYKLNNCDDALDCVSDTVMSAYEQIVNLKNEKAFSAWLFAIHRANCVKYVKLQIKSRGNDSLENATSLYTAMSDNSLIINKALDKLSDDERDIILLNVIVGLNSKEISRLTGLTAGSVRSKLSRSLSKMRGFLE